MIDNAVEESRNESPGSKTPLLRTLCSLYSVPNKKIEKLIHALSTEQSSPSLPSLLSPTDLLICDTIRLSREIDISISDLEDIKRDLALYLINNDTSILSDSLDGPVTKRLRGLEPAISTTQSSIFHSNPTHNKRRSSSFPQLDNLFALPSTSTSTLTTTTTTGGGSTTSPITQQQQQQQQPHQDEHQIQGFPSHCIVEFLGEAGSGRSETLARMASLSALAGLKVIIFDVQGKVNVG